MLMTESGATDFSGVLLKCYAAEGLVQGHHVHVVGMDESWQAELPGLSPETYVTEVNDEHALEEKRMSIAWRYQGLPCGESETTTSEFVIQALPVAVQS